VYWSCPAQKPVERALSQCCFHFWDLAKGVPQMGRMINTCLWPAAFVLGSLLGTAAPALAQCSEPIAPTGINGVTATTEQMKAALANASNFIAQSDAYQQCLIDVLEAAKAQAAANQQPFDSSIVQTTGDLVAANQRLKESVANQVNVALGDFKNSHGVPAAPAFVVNCTVTSVGPGMVGMGNTASYSFNFAAGTVSHGGTDSKIDKQSDQIINFSDDGGKRQFTFDRYSGQLSEAWIYGNLNQWWTSSCKTAQRQF
jgi:hypothetical protein